MIILVIPEFIFNKNPNNSREFITNKILFKYSENYINKIGYYDYICIYKIMLFLLFDV